MKKFLLFLLLALLGMGGYAYFQLQPLDKAGQGVERLVTIESGANAASIAKQLKNTDQVIRNEYAFRWVAEQTGTDSRFKPGEFIVRTDMELEEIALALTEGPGVLRETLRVTIPEGYTTKEIFQVLVANKLGSAEEYARLDSDLTWLPGDLPSELAGFPSLEGILFPETYEFFSDDSEEVVLTKLIGQFVKVYGSLAENDFSNVVGTTTLASMIQGEGKVGEEFPLIASVFLNRIAIDMPLQSCATIQYLLGERKEILLNEDLEIDSPYNTYMYAGFPPGPVGAPGQAALDAALNPDDTDYLFFTSNLDGTGSHTFTKTYEDHLAATHEAREKAGRK
jgi:UPF0755 protein